MSIKHDFISGQVKQIPTEEGRNAELALYRRRPDEAEAILIQVTSGPTLCVWIMKRASLQTRQCLLSDALFLCFEGWPDLPSD